MKELFYKLVNGKLLLPALLIVGGVIFVVKRLIVSSVDKSAALQLIKRIKREPSYARTIADDLDIPYGVKEDFRAEYFENLKEFIAARATRFCDFSAIVITAVNNIPKAADNESTNNGMILVGGPRG